MKSLNALDLTDMKGIKGKKGFKKPTLAIITITAVIVLSLLVLPKSYAMHISEGFLPAEWSLFWTVLFIPFFIRGIYVIKKKCEGNGRMKLLLAMSAAFCFVLSALKLPSLSGSSSHPTGVGLGSVLFGPSAMSVLGLIVLIFQALLLAHGGITTLGANAFSMAVVGPFVGYGAYLLVSKLSKNKSIAVFFAAFFADISTYLVTSIQLGLAVNNADVSAIEAITRFMSVFVITQLPLAILEAILTVVIFNSIKTFCADEFRGLGVLDAKITESAEVPGKKSKSWVTTVVLLVVAVVLCITPLVVSSNSDFAGADDSASEVVEEIIPEYEPWFEHIWEPQPETASMLFALQAAIGAGVLFGGLGYIAGTRKKQKEDEPE